MNLQKLIKEEYNNIVYNVNYKIDDVLNIGKKYYPKLKLIDNRFYINYPKNKGSFSFSGFIRLLLTDIGDYIFNSLKHKINNLYKANTTNSIYFSIGSAKFRISDHKKGSFDGNSIIYNLYTDIDKLINKINSYI